MTWFSPRNVIASFIFIISIILANVEAIGDQTIGAMIVKLSGEDKAIDAALTYLSATKVRVEAV